MDVWAYCHHCEHWFPAPRWFDRESPQPLCARCGREPAAIENRAAQPTVVAARRAPVGDAARAATVDRPPRRAPELWLG